MEEININLKIAKAMIVLCSPYSVTKPWINFEVGAAWMKRIPIAPLCHSGIVPNDLPTPIGNLQSLILNDRASISHLYDLIANSASRPKPSVDFQHISQEVLRFEERYKNELKIGVVMESICQNTPFLLKDLKDLKVGEFQELEINGFMFEKAEKDLKRLVDLNALQYHIIKVERDGAAFDPACNYYYKLYILMKNELSEFIKKSYLFMT